MSPRAAGLLVSTVIIVMVLGRLVAHGTNPTFFVVASRPAAATAQPPSGFAFVGAAGGYDGSFFYSLAVKPFQHEARDVMPLDNPPYRQQRIGYPLTAHLIAFGDRDVVPWSLVAVNVVALGAIAMLLAHRAAALGRAPILGAMLALAPGLTVAVARDLSEPLALACVLGAFAAAARSRWGLVAALGTVAVLTRETSVLAIGALGVGAIIETRDTGRASRVGPWVGGLIPLSALVGWQIYLDDRWGQFPFRAAKSGTIAAPFVGTLDAVRGDLRSLTPVSALSLALLAGMAMYVMIAVLAVRSSRAAWAEKAVVIGSAALAVFLGKDVFVSFAGSTRGLLDLVVFGGILLLGSTARVRRGVWIVPLMWLPVAAYFVARA